MSTRAESQDQGAACEGPEETHQSVENILYLDGSSADTGTHICQNPSNCSLKISAFSCM